MKILICMLCHNRLHYTKQALASLVAHTEHSYRLAIIDNGSTDGTAQWLRLNAPAGTELVLLEENCGFAAGLNEGLRLLGRDEAFVRMNNDARIDRDGWLADLVSWAERLPKATQVAHRYHDLRHRKDMRLRSENIIHLGEGWAHYVDITSPVVLMTPLAIQTIGSFWQPEGSTWYPISQDLAHRFNFSGLRQYYVSIDRVWLTHIQDYLDHNYNPQEWKPIVKKLFARREAYKTGRVAVHIPLSV